MDVDKIICGDCLEEMRQLEGKSIDLVLTDPPYFIPANFYVGTRGAGIPKRSLSDTAILQGYFKMVFAEIDRVIKPTGTYYIFCDAQSYPIFYQAMFPYCKHVRVIVWDKAISYNGYTWRHQHELIAWGEKEQAERVPTGDGDIIKCRGVLQENRNHPAEKPVELLEKLIQKSCSENGLVLDPFAGSGSTLVACHNLNRKFIGFEIDEAYCAIARKRIAAVPARLDRWSTP